MNDAPPPLTPSRLRAVAVLLRMLGLFSVAALVAVFLPHRCMDHIHQSIGLGELPDLPMVSYLSRSLSLFYAWLGALVLYLSFHIESHRRFLRFFALGGLLIAVVQTGIDFLAPVPTWWLVSEGGFLFAYFGVLNWLLRA